MGDGKQVECMGPTLALGVCCKGMGRPGVDKMGAGLISEAVWLRVWERGVLSLQLQ